MQVSNSLESKASFSSCGSYRWWLERRLNNKENIMLFIGLNPSTASCSLNDPTLRRLLNFSYSWGYGSLIVVNLFARVSSSPSIIKVCSDPIGNRNDQEISKRAFQWSNNPFCDLWVGWGNLGVWKNRNIDVLRLLKINAIKRSSKYPSARGPLALGLTLKGHPRHPLYIPNRECLKTFDLK